MLLHCVCVIQRTPRSTLCCSSSAADGLNERHLVSGPQRRAIGGTGQLLVQRQQRRRRQRGEVGVARHEKGKHVAEKGSGGGGGRGRSSGGRSGSRRVRGSSSRLARATRVGCVLRDFIECDALLSSSRDFATARKVEHANRHGRAAAGTAAGCAAMACAAGCVRVCSACVCSSVRARRVCLLARSCSGSGSRRRMAGAAGERSGRGGGGERRASSDEPSLRSSSADTVDALCSLACKLAIGSSSKRVCVRVWQAGSSSEAKRSEASKRRQAALAPSQPTAASAPHSLPLTLSHHASVRISLRSTRWRVEWAHANQRSHERGTAWCDVQSQPQSSPTPHPTG